MGEDTVTPGQPAVHCVEAFQEVNWPTRSKGRVWPCSSVGGSIRLMAGVPTTTVNVPVSISVAAVEEVVVMVNVRCPMPAWASMVMLATALPRPVTWKEFTAMPAPNAAVVLPGSQLVYLPARETSSVCPARPCS